jgi:hypothetical protein
VLLDEWVDAICKFIPVTKLSIMVIGVTHSGKPLLENGHLLGEAETGFGQSQVPFNALIKAKRRKVHLGHDVHCFLKRGMKFARDLAACSRRE